MAMQTEVKTQAPPLQSEDTTVSPADVVKIELTLGHSFIGKRQIQFQWDCNVAITTGEFELVRLQPYELFYKGSQFSCTVEYTSHNLPGDVRYFSTELYGLFPTELTALNLKPYSLSDWNFIGSLILRSIPLYTSL